LLYTPARKGVPFVFLKTAFAARKSTGTGGEEGENKAGEAGRGGEKSEKRENAI